MHRAWRWARVKQAMNKTLASMINPEEEFIFYPLLTLLRNCSTHALP